MVHEMVFLNYFVDLHDRKSSKKGLCCKINIYWHIIYLIWNVKKKPE